MHVSQVVKPARGEFLVSSYGCVCLTARPLRAWKPVTVPLGYNQGRLDGSRGVTATNK